MEADSRQHLKASTSRNPLEQLGAHVSARLEEGDIRGTIRIASSNESFAPVNSHTSELLNERHPPRHPNSENPSESEHLLSGRSYFT